MDLGLKGRRAVVTGGSRGLGKAMTRRLLDEGCDVVICARNASDVEATVKELGGHGGTIYGRQVDVVDAAALHEFIDTAAKLLGGLDLLVACAGGLSGGPRLSTIDAEDWRTTLDLNVTHPALAAQAATPWMVKAGGGAMVFISSAAGLHPWTRSHYGAAKAGEISLAGSLARELGPENIRVNALSPGSVTYPGSIWEQRREADPEGFAAWLEAEFPAGRLGTSEEVADVTCFLLSERASWISGTNIVVDGGQNPMNMMSLFPLPGRWRD